MNETKIQVEMTEHEAELFVLFRKHQAEFTRLLQEGMFNTFKGRIVVHKNGKVIQLVELTTFSR